MLSILKPLLQQVLIFSTLLGCRYGFGGSGAALQSSAIFGHGFLNTIVCIQGVRLQTDSRVAVQLQREASAWEQCVHFEGFAPLVPKFAGFVSGRHPLLLHRYMGFTR